MTIIENNGKHLKENYVVLPTKICKETKERTQRQTLRSQHTSFTSSTVMNLVIQLQCLNTLILIGVRLTYGDSRDVGYFPGSKSGWKCQHHFK